MCCFDENYGIFIETTFAKFLNKILKCIFNETNVVFVETIHIISTKMTLLSLKWIL
uniref:Sf85 n=1 Tax=Spodoptera frugiperda nuclear polyhedrosis virus TaxID=10455 RepID=A0A0R5RHT5_NPVSF|nr:hypothetical protein [Spodoptera frugiperda multiple nucleopolyhedrovirus]QED39998.1 hypothetical protein [Spodoptera frugiperda multiple nucleopolyhedrovirus]QRN46197.1 Sf85 [Spodoptera frugiperda multiple nucleopolyhedrovirus]